MFKNEKGEFSLISVLVILFGSILIVSAAVLNSTSNSSLDLLNDTLTIPIVNNSINLNESPEIGTLIDGIANQTLNVTIPIDNVASGNQSVGNSTANEVLPNLMEIIETNKHKLNDETENYFRNIKNKNEKRKFILKFKNSIDEGKLANVTLDREIRGFKVASVTGKVKDIENLIDDNETELLELEQNVEVLGDSIPFNVKKVKADSAWNLSNGSNVKVAVLDTGIGLHDDLVIAGGVSFVDNNYYDGNGHGTAVAGVIAALLNNEGLVGVSPSVNLYSVKIMQSSTGDLSNAIAGIQWAIDNNISIISMSFGFDSYSQIFKEVLQEAYDKNILLIAASGNNGQDNILYPAKYDTVIAVGATTENNNIASFSSYGFEQELVAPGVNINSTSLNNQYSVSSGTSLAAPHVAGVAALIKSFNNSLTNEQIRAKLRNDAFDLGASGKDYLFGYGLVQINLNATNYTFVNTSYFYEVFNISNYGFPNITYNFWLDGTGTIDNVNFSVGYYLVNVTFNDGRKKSNVYYVSENGTIRLLTLFMNYSDDYTFSCPSGTNCATDGIAWINGALSAYFSPNPGETKQAECLDHNYTTENSPHTFDKCYGVQSDIDACKTNIAAFSTDCSQANPSCTSVDNNLNYHALPTSTSKVDTVHGEYCYSGWSLLRTVTGGNYYICYKRQYHCISNTQYEDRCYYGSSNTVFSTITCSSGTTCDSSLADDNADFGASGTHLPNTPCSSGVVQSVCNGTIAAIVTDSKRQFHCVYDQWVN